jgi:hypothetical protein
MSRKFQEDSLRAARQQVVAVNDMIAAIAPLHARAANGVAKEEFGIQIDRLVAWAKELDETIETWQAELGS